MPNQCNRTCLRRKKVGFGPSFVSAAKDVVGGSNGYSGRFWR